ncbi:MAG: NAD(P)-dependent oxidoreductase [Bacteroidota bacterium]
MARTTYPKIALIREGKVPPDSRVALTPQQVATLRNQGLDITVVPSEHRVFADEEYAELGIPLQQNLEDRDLLLGIKEVNIDDLVSGKTYCFFAHVIKKQPYNRKLLLALLNKRIRHLDYEVMTDTRGRRLIAFGFFAGVVGAHNGLWAYGRRTGSFDLPRMKDLFDYAAAKKHYNKLQLPPIKVVLTGTGRVGKGAKKVLEDMGMQRVKPQEFLTLSFEKPVYTQLVCEDYARRKDGQPFDKADFYAHPSRYQSSFLPFTRVADVFINGIFWDNEAPAFFTREEMMAPEFNIRTIADVTCDIAPISSVPSTIKASTIAHPVFGYDPITNAEIAPYQEGYVDVMSIDNLPSELPRDASQAFGEMFIEHILPEFAKSDSDILQRATVTENGELGPHFKYLRAYKEGQ